MKKVTNWWQIALLCSASILIGIVIGPFLQMQTFWFLDRVLPHPDGYGYHEVNFSGIQGALGMYVIAMIGAVIAQFLTLPLGLSFILSPRSSVHVCIISALLLSGLLAIFDFPRAKHDLILFWGFPFLCMATLTARAAYLHWATINSRI